MRHPFLRTLAGSAATPTDSDFEYVQYLVHGNGTNGAQNNTFLDGSTNNFTITRNGNTTQGTFSPYGDNWSNLFDGSGDYLTVADSSQFDLSGDFTIEAWVLINAGGANRGVITLGNRNTTGGISIYWSSSALFRVRTNSSDIISSGGVGLHTWYHVALVRSGTAASNLKLYVNGTLANSATNTASFEGVAGNGVCIGASYTGSFVEPHSGYISNVRVVNGSAVYTANFTPSTAPLTAITNTSLLTCKSNRFQDVSSNNFTVTRNGDVSVQRFSPFSPTAAYAAGTIGGSGYFDGNGDFVTTPDNAAFDFGTGDFTIECWVYIAGNSSPDTDSARRAGIFSTYPASGTLNDAYLLDILGSTTTTGTGLSFGSFQSGVFYGVQATSTTISQFAWHHIAVARSGTTTRLFLDGAQIASGTLGNQNVNCANTVKIGRAGYTGYISDFNGYISNLRVLKGTAQYTGTYTVPTSPLTAITNTQLLLDFTNAAILDNAMIKVMETVGNAQIDTTIKKFGTGSVKFDGNGDELLFPTINVISGASFCCEAWVYISSLAADIVVFGGQDTGANNNVQLYIATNGSVTGWINGALPSSASGAVTTGQWYHIAWAREGNTVRIFIDGTLAASGTNGNAGNIMRVGSIGGTTRKWFNGYLDEIRITTGIPRYTAAFTAPTAAFPDL